MTIWKVKTTKIKTYLGLKEDHNKIKKNFLSKLVHSITSRGTHDYDMWSFSEVG